MYYGCVCMSYRQNDDQKLGDVSPRQKQTDTKSVLIMNTIHSCELLEKTTVKPTATNVIRNTNSSVVTSIKAITIK